MTIISALRTTRTPALAFVAIGLFWGTFAAMVPVTKARLGVEDAAFGGLLLCSAAGLLVSMWLAPRLDRLLGARGMQVAAAAFGATMLLPGIVTHPLAFAATMAALGLASGTLDVIMNARVSELEARAARPLMNANHGMFSLAYAVAAVVTGLAREAGFSAPTIFGSAAVAILVLALSLWMEVETESPEGGRSDCLPVHPVLLCGSVALLAFAGEAAVEAWSALHVERTLGGGAAEGALGPAMLGLTMAFGRFSGQAVSARLDEFHIMAGGTALAMGGAAIVAAATTIPLAYFGFGLLGLGVSVIGPIAIGLAGRLVPAQVRTDAIARTAVLGFMAFFLAPMVMGVVSQIAGLRVAFLVMGLLVGLIFVLLPPLRRLLHQQL